MSTCKHDVRPAQFVGSVVYGDYSYLVLVNCSGCHTTLALPLWLSEEAMADVAAVEAEREEGAIAAE